jgi:RHS repeat-associated protein
MLSAFAPWSADECIRAFESEGKKPHQGVAPQNPALHQGIAWSNSTSALGLQNLAIENRVGSRCTGKERDSESGLDNFGARYDASSLGRFMTPDNGSAQDSGNPQSWNLYSYVMNNPTTNVDPDGHDCIHINTDSGKFEGWDSGDCDNSTEEKANSGIYVDGTINSLQFNSSAGSLDFGYTAENGNVGAGTILGVAQPQKAAPINDPGMIPGMLGPGDLILFSGVKTPSVVTDALGKVLGSIFGKTVEETGAAVEDIVAKAGSSVGNQSIKASSRAAAEEAAEKWVGAGARPIMREGEQVGFVSADGTKVARWTSAGKPDPYINLTNNTTGGNLHVHF